MITAKLKTDKMIRVGLVVAVILLLATVFMTVQASKSLIEVSENVQKSHIGLLKLEELFSNLTHAESGVRGYVITGTEAYLEPYYNTIKTINEEISGVRKLIPDDPIQEARIDEVESLASERLALLKESIDIRRGHRFEEAQKLILTGKRRTTIMGYLRDAINEIKADEYVLLNSRLEHQRKIFRKSIFLNASVIFLAFIFAGLNYLTINLDLTKHRKAEENLKESLIRLSKKSKYERIVSTIIQSIHKSGNLRDVLESAVESMSKNVDRANFCSFYIIEGEEAVLKAHRGLTSQYIQQASRIPHPKGITWKTIIEGQTIYVPDVDKDQVIGPAGRDMGIKSHVSVPIRYEGFNVGCGSIGAFEKHQFGEDEFKLLEVVADQIEIAINNVKQQELLRESEERYRTLFDQSPVGVYIFNKNFNITHCNERFAHILQTSRDKIIGINVQELKNPCVLPLMEKVFGGSTENYEGLYETSFSQAKLYLSIRLSPLLDDKGNVAAGMAVVKDISERKRFENELRESEERFRNMANTAPVMIWVSGPDKQCNYFNRGWLDFTGRTMDENVGMGWTDSVHPHDLQYCLDTYSHAFEKRQDFEMEYRLRRFDGEYRWVLDRGIPRFLSDGTFTGYIGSCIDVTERKLANIQLKARDKHQQAVVELGHIALAGTDLSTLMNKAVSMIAKTLGVEYVKILELQPDGETLLLRAGVGWKEGYVGHETVGAGNESQAGHTLLCNEILIVNDLLKETRFTAPQLLKDHSVRSGISTVIHGKERPYGVLGAHSVSIRTYTKDEVHFLQGIGNLISEAVQRSSIEDELMIINTIMESVNKSSKLDDVFETAIDKVLELTDINIVGIYLIDEVTNEAVLEAHRGYPDQYLEKAGRIPYPRGVTWRVIETDEVYVVQDVSTDPNVGPVGKESGFRSFMSVPIKGGERTIGAIHFHSNKKNKFGRREIEIFTSIGTQIAIAVAKAKKTEDLKLINEDLSTLNVITTSVHKSLNLEEVLNIALDKVVDITEFDIIMVYLVDEDTNEAVLQAHRGLTEDYIERAGRIPYPKGVTWRVIKSSDLSYIDDVQKDPDLGPAGKALGHHTHVSVPIVQENKTIGVVNFASRRVLGLTSRNINLLNAVGNQIGIAIAQASLYEKSQEQSRELRELYEDLDKRSKDLEIVNTITQAVHKSLDLEEIYEIALDSVVSLEDVDMAMIYLVDEDRKEAILQAQRNLPQDYINRAGRIPYPKGTTWRVINKGEVLKIQDVQKEPTVGPAGRDLGHHSALGIPLNIEEKVIGVFWFLSYREHKFDKQEIDLLCSIGGQIGTAITKAKLYQDSNRKREQIELVYELSKSLNMDLSLDVVLSKIIEVARQSVKARYAALAMYDENNKITKFETNLTPQEMNLIGNLPEGKGLLGVLFKEHKILRVDDIAKHSRSCGFPPNHPPMKTLLGVPIIFRGYASGAIYLTEKEGGMPFDKHDEELVETLCSTAAISIENARLFNKIVEAQKELTEAHERLLALDQMKDEFISMASHEVRTPLTAINGFVSMLLEGDYGSLPTEAVEALADINTATNRLIGLTNYMLDVSRIEQGRLEFKISDFDIEEVCDKILTDLKPIAEEKGLKLEYQKPTVAGALLVSGDKFRVEQVIVNLIGNALKFTEGGVVIITHHANDSHIITDVIDTGIGIPEKDQGLLFQKFRAVQHSLSGDYKGGIGMGLYISKQFLNEMKGDVWLEKSELGKGSTFCFCLPKARDQLAPDREHI